MKIREFLQPKLEHLAGEALKRLPEKLAKPLARELSIFASPFRGHLRPSIRHWDLGSCELELPVRAKWRVRRDELHSGVVATLGEMAACIVLRRRLALRDLQISLREMNFVYHGPVGRKCFAYAELTAAEANMLRKRILEQKRTLASMEATVRGEQGETIAIVRSVWNLSAGVS